MEKYTRLSAQSETLRQRLSITLHASDDDATSPTLTPFTTPDRTLNSYIQIHSSEQPYPMPIFSSHTYADPASTEDSLYELNQQIKSTLTELLNCESVKHDKAYRQWVQGRLMDAEHELKRQRRRRSSVINGETLRTIESWGSGTPGGFSGGWRND